MEVVKPVYLPLSLYIYIYALISNRRKKSNPPKRGADKNREKPCSSDALTSALAVPIKNFSAPIRTLTMEMVSTTNPDEQASPQVSDGLVAQQGSSSCNLKLSC